VTEKEEEEEEGARTVIVIAIVIVLQGLVGSILVIHHRTPLNLSKD
jgi:hypothetical protein